MKLIKYLYQENEIEFQFQGNRNVMVNATEMAKIFGKEVTHFLENNSTQNFINSCLKTRNSEFLEVKNKEDLVQGKQKSGTWMHRILALKFAAWLNPDFEVWVYSTIDKILNEYASRQMQSIKRTVELQREKDSLTNQLAKDNPKFLRFLEINKQLKKERASRTSTTKDQFANQFSLFDDLDDE